MSYYIKLYYNQIISYCVMFDMFCYYTGIYTYVYSFTLLCINIQVFILHRFDQVKPCSVMACKADKDLEAAMELHSVTRDELKREYQEEASLAVLKHPGGWGTALEVDHVLQNKVLGVVLPCTLYHEIWY